MRHQLGQYRDHTIEVSDRLRDGSRVVYIVAGSGDGSEDVLTLPPRELSDEHVLQRAQWAIENMLRPSPTATVRS